MCLANQAIFSTAEIIKCMEINKTHFASDEEILDTIYCDEETTSDNIAFAVKSSPVCRPVLTDVANLYLRQQIIFGRARAWINGQASHLPSSERSFLPP